MGSSIPTDGGGLREQPRPGVAARTLSLQPRVQRKLVAGNALWKRVRDGLQQGLSPEQVSGTLSRMDKPVYVSPVKLDHY